MSSEEPFSIVVIDDDPAIRLSCEKILVRMGCEVLSRADGESGVAAVRETKPDLAVVDLKMPGIGGIEVIGRVLEIDPLLSVVVITGYATVETAVDAMKAGAYDFLPKPFTPDELRIIVRRGLERRRLVLANREAEVERELMHRKFVSFVAHQLRTPLVAVRQYLDVLRHLGERPEAEARRTEWFERCVVRIDELQALIEDWLTLARLEGGRGLARERRPVDLGLVVRGVATGYEEMARRRGVRLALHLPDEGPFALGDRNCLGVLVDNLVTNAVKYNLPDGLVEIEARREGDTVRLEVRDTGIGIPVEARDRLFDEFYRVPRDEADESAGTGLGLPICKRIVDELGGSIEVESSVGDGSRFIVDLPATDPP
jgi:signal transduction histidine kinase